MFGWFGWLWKKWFQTPRLERVRVILYTRSGCHLCETAWDLLRQEQARYRFRLDTVDVDTDPELKTLHGDQVPVVMVDGKVRFRGVVNPILLKRLLQAETRRSRRRNHELPGA